MPDAVITGPAGSPADIEQLAAALGGSLPADGDSPGYGPQISFGRQEPGLRSGVTPLVEHGLLRVRGADAASFLQAQLTSDIAGLGAGEVALAGYCSIKGRLAASFWVWRDDTEEAFWLACSRDIAAPIARRLSMFVLRAKAKVEDLSETMALVGALSLEHDPLPAAVAGPVRLPGVEVTAETVAALRAPGDEPDAAGLRGLLRIERTLRLVTLSDLPQVLAGLRRDGAILLPTPAWRLLEVLSGTARINAGSQELFVPQMVNFELVGGVNFRKGCYPGQEIVARSQYLGKLKRRMFLGLGTGAVPAPGADVFAQALEEPVGQVVLAAPLPDAQRFVVLFESRIAAVAAQDAEHGAAPAPSELRVGASSLRRLPLPYAIPANDQPNAR